MNTCDIIEFLSRSEGEYRYILNKKASEITSFRIGGIVSAAVYPQNKGALCALLRYLREKEIKYTVLGFGSNVLVDDGEYNGVFVMTEDINDIETADNIMTVGAGRGITSCASAAQRVGLSGLSFAYGIPGTVGGAVVMNAGAYGGEIKDVIVSADVYDPEKDEIVTLSVDDLKLGYRESAVKNTDLVVLSAVFLLKYGKSEDILAEMNDYMSRRRSKQPLEFPSAGSVFKRYPGYFTAQLIDEAGLKGYRIGGAEVSEKHAGFIINRGGATAQDVKMLISEITERIREKNGIEIERELIYIK